jgi:hypothetical protein
MSVSISKINNREQTNKIRKPGNGGSLANIGGFPAGVRGGWGRSPHLEKREVTK